MTQQNYVIPMISCPDTERHLEISRGANERMVSTEINQKEVIIPFVSAAWQHHSMTNKGFIVYILAVFSTQLLFMYIDGTHILSLG